jgi:hypothetical protein
MKPYQTVLAVRGCPWQPLSGITLWALASATESDIRGHRAAVVDAACTHDASPTHGSAGR